MIKLENHLGCIEISRNFLTTLVNNTVTGCFGVLQMSYSGKRQSLLEKFIKQNPSEKGINIKYIKQALVIELHIIAIYGINISEVVNNIIDKVSYTLLEVTDVPVSRVNVFVDGIKTE